VEFFARQSEIRCVDAGEQPVPEGKEGWAFLFGGVLAERMVSAT
jgi:hypothetical protein